MNLKADSECPDKTVHSVVSASVALLDVRPTTDQEVVGSTPAGLATFFRGD